VAREKAGRFIERYIGTAHMDVDELPTQRSLNPSCPRFRISKQNRWVKYEIELISITYLLESFMAGAWLVRGSYRSTEKLPSLFEGVDRLISSGISRRRLCLLQ
jgi:hypothetical protein